MRVLLVPNTGKPETVEAVRTLRARVTDAGHEVVLASDDAEVCGVPELGRPPTELGVPDLTVALGGDGTIIKAVHLQGDVDTPILGVNFGRVGFLSGAASDDLTESVEAVLAGDACREKRMTLQAVVEQGGREVGHYQALNEVFVGRRGASRVVDLSVRVDGTDLAQYTCDGMIVASPTGSTAYALSSGGPIVSPAVEGLVLVPVSPHTLADRAMVLGPGAEVEISCPSARAVDVCLTVDGQAVPCRMALERVRVWRGDRDVTLLKLDGRDFLEVAARNFLGG